MIIRAGFTLSFDCAVATPLVLTLNIHPSRRADLLSEQVLRFDPAVQAHDYIDGHGNACTRLVAPAGVTTIWTDFTVHDEGRPDAIAPEAAQHAVSDLPDEAIVFLLGSRYCESDRFTDLAWTLFGDSRRGWARVQAICDFVHNYLTFDYTRADSTRTAFGAYQDKVGVCRDFAHLAIALCRAMNIPARYCTGYLGDIGVEPSDDPMDFSAWFEAYLGGRWYTFDARHNTPRIGRILVARGRDATDVALSTSFGNAQLVRFEVTTDEVDAEQRRCQPNAIQIPAPPASTATAPAGGWQRSPVLTTGRADGAESGYNP